MIPLQETFDTVVNHLRKQNKRALKFDNGYEAGCMYRSEDGLMCAVGCLIKDEDYNPKFEGQSVLTVGGNPTIVGELLASYGHDLILCRSLQYIHDNSAPENWETQFEKTARLYDIAYKPKE